MNKPHIIFKRGKYWVFGSKKASLDCMPQYIHNTLLEACYCIKYINAWVKRDIIN